MDHESDSASGRTDGAVIELARDDVARKKFLKMAGRGIGSAAAASSLAAFIAACGSSSTTTTQTSAPKPSSSTPSSSAPSSTAAAAAPTGDLGIVNYALTLEYLESQFYDKVIASGLFSGSTLATLKVFGSEEAQHVAALEKVAASLGKPATKPVGKFSLTSASAVAALADTVENLGAAAYLGQAPNIQNKQILAAALAIHSVEARHAATLNLVLKKNPTPTGAFAKPMTMAEVLAIVKPFIA